MRGLAVTTGVIFAFVIIPFLLFEDDVTKWTSNLLQSQNGILKGMLLVSGLLATDILLPIPSSLLSSIAGRMLGFYSAFVAIWIGMTTSALAGYWLGAKGISSLLSRNMQNELRSVEASISGQGWLYVSVSRSIPVLAETSAVLAGATGFGFWKYVKIVCLSHLGIAAVYAAVGSFVTAGGSLWPAIAAGLILPGISQFVAKYLFAKR